MQTRRFEIPVYSHDIRRRLPMHGVRPNQEASDIGERHRPPGAALIGVEGNDVTGSRSHRLHYSAAGHGEMVYLADLSQPALHICLLGKSKLLTVRDGGSEYAHIAQRLVPHVNLPRYLIQSALTFSFLEIRRDHDVV